MPLRTFPTLVLLMYAVITLVRSADAAPQHPAPRASPVLITFDIAPGPLSDALDAFERTAGTTLRTSASIGQLTSSGVHGSFTAADALSRILDGTGLAARIVTDGTFVIEPASPVHRVTTTGQLSHYSADESRTAMKTPTRLLDIPQTVNVIPRALIVDQQAQSIADAVRNVPGVGVAQGEGNRDQVVLRGISTASDFFVNGIRDDQERFRDLYNVESIEVVQGPAAVLFGRGGAGGMVNAVTIPTTGTRSEVAVELGGYQHKRATARVGGSAGSTLLRLNAMAEDSGSFRDAYFLRRYGISPVARMRLGADSALTISFEHLGDRRLADRGIPSEMGAPVHVSASQFFGSRGQNLAESGVDSTAVTLEQALGRSVRLRNNFLAGVYDKFYRNVYPGTAVSTADTLTLSAYDHTIDRTNIFNQTDLIIDRAGERFAHTLLAGMEIGRQAQVETRHTAAPILNVPVSDSVRDADFAAAPLTIDRTSDATTIAGYVQDQIAFLSRWKAVAGLRVDRFALAVDDRLPLNTDLARVDVAASPRAGLLFQPNARISIYTSYSYTFLPSGERLGLAVNTAELRPENTKNYEAGTKLDALGGRLTLAASVFRLDRNNVKAIDPGDPARLVLTGQQRTEGVTISTSGRITRQWELSGGYANLDSRITKTTSAAPAGHRPGLVPRHQASLWTSHDVTDAIRIAVGLVMQTEAFTSFTNAVRLPAYARADSTVFYRFRNTTLSIGVTNVFDARYYPTANGDNNISPGAPRTALVSLRHTF